MFCICQKHDLIPSSCIFLMVHVVIKIKIVNIVQAQAMHIEISMPAPHALAEVESEIDSRPRQGQVSMFQSLV